MSIHVKLWDTHSEHGTKDICTLSYISKEAPDVFRDVRTDWTEQQSLNLGHR